MKQVSHSDRIVSALESDDYDEEQQQQLSEILTAQLSHSDGIRGFFVTYLTSDDDEDDDLDVPPTLVAAMSKANKEELIPLACT